MTDHDTEWDVIDAQLSEAGYLIVVRRPDGGTGYQLTDAGAQVARQLAMSSEAGQEALLEALLDASQLLPPRSMSRSV